MKRYEGSCHCGAVRFEVEAEFDELTACNCSMCGRMGWLLFFVPESQMAIVSGEDALVDYQFGRKHIHHVFCRTCGVRAFGHGSDANGSEMYSINARCLHDFDVGAYPVKEFDGKSL